MKNEKQNLKALKFKILYNINQKTRKSSHWYEVNTRETLKILYLMGFQERLQNNLFNRNSVKLLDFLNLNMDTYTNTIIQDNPIFKKTYNYTIIINILYKLHKLRKPI